MALAAELADRLDVDAAIPKGIFLALGPALSMSFRKLMTFFPAGFARHSTPE